MTDTKGQISFLEPIPEKPKKKKVAKKKSAKKEPKIKAPKPEKKSKEGAVPKGKIKLEEGDDFYNEDIIKKQVKKIIKHNNDFSIQKLMDRFDPRFIHIVAKWSNDPDNKTWLFHRMYNNKMKWNDTDYLTWKCAFEDE